MPRILVVDDAEFDRHLVGGLLEKVPGCEVEFAADVAEALALIPSLAPDLVITDLMMPGQNGLDLVSAVRQQYAKTPVILITAHGSEALAADALESGAAGYVPKSRLGQRLLTTVEEVLSVSSADRHYARLLAGLDLAHCVFHLENDASLFDPLIDLAHELMTAVGLSDATGRFRVGVALKEALLNACFHGNLEVGFEEGSPDAALLSAEEIQELLDSRRLEPPYCERRIRVEWSIQDAETRFIVGDEGPGFDYQAALANSELDVQGLKCQRGLVLMRTFMDEVGFSADGRQVTMVKRAEKIRDDSTIFPKNAPES